MDFVRQFLKEENGEEDYFKALKLTDEDAKCDPVTEPYRSMYEARKIWVSLRSRIDNRVNENIVAGVNWTYLTAALDLKLGMNYSDTEEKSTGEEHLRKCIFALDGVECNELTCNVAQIALNQLGILTAETKGAKPGLDCLIRSELLHGKYVETVGSCPWTVDDLFRVTSYASCTNESFGEIHEENAEREKQRELEQAVRRIVLTREYAGDQRAIAPDLAGRLQAGLVAGRLDADALLAGYCKLLHERHGSFEEVARRTNLDRRTAKAYVLKHRA